MTGVQTCALPISFCINVPSNCLSEKLTNYYGSPRFNTQYSVPLVPYIENRYASTLAGECTIEVRKKKRQRTSTGNLKEWYPKDPDYVTGKLVVLPLINGVTPEEALKDILVEEIGYKVESPIPDWIDSIIVTGVTDLQKEVRSIKKIIDGEKGKIFLLGEKIGNLNSYRKLLYSSGSELEDIVQKSFELLGAKVIPAKYAEEEYIVIVGKEEFLVEVKGVTKSIGLGHLRQLNDYLSKFEEDTGKDCKGVLIGNAWRNILPNKRERKNTPIFPNNVIKRSQQWGISLVSSLTLFEGVLSVLENEKNKESILSAITTTDGVVKL